MAKHKPNVAFLEALQQEKKRRGVENKPVGFRTPEWFFNHPQNSIPTGMGFQRPARPAWKNPVYWGIAVAVVGIIVAIVIFAGRGKGPVNGPSTDQLQAGPAHPEVMEPGTGASTATPPPSNPIPAIPQTRNPAPPVQLDRTASSREVGKNYVIIQSYLDQKTAEEAADALKKAGIDCTIERNLPYAPKAYVVMGTTGFIKISSPEYKQYVGRIEAVSAKFANVPGARKWRKFEPNPYMWR